MGEGAIIQISATGVENTWLTVEPKTTFWKYKYANHTMFAIQSHDLVFDPGHVAYGRKSHINLTRSGDLITDLWLVFELTALNNGNGNARFVNDIGRALIQDVSVEIHGVTYDTQEGELMHAEELLNTRADLTTAKLSGNAQIESDLELWAMGAQKIYVPLTFWFTNDRERALPMVSLYQHEVKLIFSLRDKQDLIREVSAPTAPYDPTTETGGLLQNMSLLCDYVYLTSAEREFFAAGNHTYLMSEAQKANVISIPPGSTTLRVDLNFLHPCREMIWFFRKRSNGSGGEKAYMDWTGEEVGANITEAFETCRLLINNQDRIAPRSPLYFRKVVTSQSHTNIPSKNVYNISYDLKPEDKSPHGSLNWSRIDSSQMLFTFGAPLTEEYEFHGYAKTVNWLSINHGLSKKHFA